MLLWAWCLPVIRLLCAEQQILWLLESLNLKTRADDHRADRKDWTMAETLRRIRRGVAWRRGAELFSLTSTGRWSLNSSAWQTEATEHRVKLRGDHHPAVSAFRKPPRTAVPLTATRGRKNPAYSLKQKHFWSQHIIYPFMTTVQVDFM